MKRKLSQMASGLLLLWLSAASLAAAERKTLPTSAPTLTGRLHRLAPLPATNRLQLAIGLPLRDRDQLTNLIHQLYSPASPMFHQFVTPDQFTRQFGPTEQDYQNVVNYAKSNGLEIVRQYGNRALLDVAGSVADIETMFHLELSLYQHPTQERQFYAPDVAPSVVAGLPISGVVGLDDYNQPQPRVRKVVRPFRKEHANIDNGTGTNGCYLGRDFRNAYVPGVSSPTGSGQVVGLFEFVGYTASDIAKYETLAGLPNVPLQNVVLPGAAGLPDSSFNHDAEIALDIDMVISMAPGLAEVLVVEAYTGVDGMNELASPSQGVPLANQVSSSWGFSESASLETQLLEMQAQGQSFFLASGDTGAPAGGVQTFSADDNDATMVGGTELSMTGTGVAWQSETVWDFQFATGASTGYVETALGIPDYQQGINTSANGGSLSYRNVPDVAMCADYIEIVYTQGFTNMPAQTGLIGEVGGTSAAAPLWAAFTALVNEQAAAEGKPPVGFLNPAIYDIAQSPLYTRCFHDVTNGNNVISNSSNLYYAGPGYDNCTGLGSPNGINLINALAGLAGPVYVNFNYTGFIEDGTYINPFSTLAGGVNAVSVGGTIFIETAGSSSETMTISKPLTITADDGPATVGQ